MQSAIMVGIAPGLCNLNRTIAEMFGLVGKKGPRFSGATGDFAEYHKRDPTQTPFEEGDVVGFGASGLTRITAGMRQLGVISRQAIVVGSMPAESDQDDYDMVTSKVQKHGPDGLAENARCTHGPKLNIHQMTK